MYADLTPGPLLARLLHCAAPLVRSFTVRVVSRSLSYLAAAAAASACPSPVLSVSLSSNRAVAGPPAVYKQVIPLLVILT